MRNAISILRSKVLLISTASIVLFGTAACDATKKSASNASSTNENVTVPIDESQRSREGNEMDARAGMHNEMSGNRGAGQGMGSGMGGMKDDHMGMGSGGNMGNSNAPADPAMKADPPMKDDM